MSHTNLVRKNKLHLCIILFIVFEHKATTREQPLVIEIKKFPITLLYTLSYVHTPKLFMCEASSTSQAQETCQPT